MKRVIKNIISNILCYYDIIRFMLLDSKSIIEENKRLEKLTPEQEEMIRVNCCGEFITGTFDDDKNKTDK